ncbi:MAG: NAD(P) transhydrogenase subunit alpha [Acidobacteriota bacterium]|nr:NAD(P) transhydrogenase subunit alpha [Acidobacteriota bacterium]
MRIAILKEARPDETRVALTAEAVKSLTGKGAGVTIESGAGLNAGISDAEYEAAGAVISGNRAELLATADVLPVVNLLPDSDQAQLKSGAVVVGFLRPLDDPGAFQTAVARGATLFAVELVPRITRAQSMDALSSMATVAGYKAVIVAADRLPKLFPLLMTAAGTIPPAKVLVLGAGVAGLQAIATARRLGAVVEAYDVRAAAGEQVKSLGAKFIEVDLGGLQTEDKGGYAKELSPEALELGRQAIARAAKVSDVVITTAQVPGRRAPLMIPTAAVEDMHPGSIIFDLAAPAGGNCELTKPGETVVHKGVIILGPLNLAAEMPVHASMLYSRNLTKFLDLIVKKGELVIDRADEIIAGSCVAHGGQVVNERVAAAIKARA